jgi:hypothetical protein
VPTLGGLRPTLWVLLGTLLASGCKGTDVDDVRRSAPTPADSGPTSDSGGTLAAGMGSVVGPGKSGSPVGQDAQAGDSQDESLPAENAPCPLSNECDTIGERSPSTQSVVCPGSAPAEGDLCENEGLQCSYGNQLTARCRDIFRCEDSTWIQTYSRANATCQLPVGSCPAGLPDQTTCTVPEGVSDVYTCDYPGDVSCYCDVTHFAPGTEGTWACFAPPRNGACPSVLPNLGDTCDNFSLTCRYGHPVYGCFSPPFSTVFCFQGVWERGVDIGCNE